MAPYNSSNITQVKLIWKDNICTLNLFLSTSTSLHQENPPMLFAVKLQKCFEDHKTSPDFWIHEGE